MTPGSPLSAAERVALDAKASKHDVFLPAISLWEAQVLHHKRRLQLPIAFPEWLARATDERMISVLPLSVEVILALDDLPLSFHGDPADRLIVATARAYGMPLATRDRAIRRSRTATLWRP